MINFPVQAYQNASGFSVTRHIIEHSPFRNFNSLVVSFFRDNDEEDSTAWKDVAEALRLFRFCLLESALPPDTPALKLSERLDALRRAVARYRIGIPSEVGELCDRIIECAASVSATHTNPMHDALTKLCRENSSRLLIVVRSKDFETEIRKICPDATVVHSFIHPERDVCYDNLFLFGSPNRYRHADKLLYRFSAPHVQVISWSFGRFDLPERPSFADIDSSGIRKFSGMNLVSSTSVRFRTVLNSSFVEQEEVPVSLLEAAGSDAGADDDKMLPKKFRTVRLVSSAPRNGDAIASSYRRLHLGNNKKMFLKEDNFVFIADKLLVASQRTKISEESLEKIRASDLQPDNWILKREAKSLASDIASTQEPDLMKRAFAWRESFQQQLSALSQKETQDSINKMFRDHGASSKSLFTNLQRWAMKDTVIRSEKDFLAVLKFIGQSDRFDRYRRDMKEFEGLRISIGFDLADTLRQAFIKACRNGTIREQSSSDDEIFYLVPSHGELHVYRIESIESSAEPTEEIGELFE